jgi:uncharacterized membrane protein YqjE
MKRNLSGLILLGGLALATLGMALVTFGVVVPALFFPGVYLLAVGMLVSAGGALLGLFGPQPA